MITHRHHRKRRSQGGSDEFYNIMHVTPEFHAYIHANVAESYEKGWLVHSYDDPRLIPVQEFVFGVFGWEPKTMLERLHEDAEQVPATCKKKCPKCKGKGEIIEEPKPEKLEEAKPKTVYSIRVPKKVLEAGEDGAAILKELIQGAREKYAPELGWKDDVGDYYVLTAVLVKDAQT